MDIRTLEQNDLNLLTDLIPPGWDAIMPALEFCTSSDFCFPVKITIDQKIVGIGTTTIHNDVAWLAHIIVHPDYRNQSIGRVITHTLMEISNTNRCDTIYLLATELGEPVYKKAGFETETEYVYFKGIKMLAGSMYSEHILPFSNDFKTQISALDRHISGEDRMIQLEPYLSTGFVFVKDNEVEGFYLPALGDGLIVATTFPAGQALMELRLTSKDFAAFPIDNITAAAYMQQHNFKKVRSEKRMRSGKPRDWQPENLYNRIGGNLG